MPSDSYRLLHVMISCKRIGHFVGLALKGLTFMNCKGLHVSLLKMFASKWFIATFVISYYYHYYCCHYILSLPNLLETFTSFISHFGPLKRENSFSNTMVITASMWVRPRSQQELSSEVGPKNFAECTVRF